ncbi:MAG TPA: YciI family protein [Gaiellaceae bacterium]|jgi:hypothetical protein
MKYLMLVCVDPAIEHDENAGNVDDWFERAGSARLLGNALQSPSDGWTIRVRGGKPFVTDGPFAETKEFVAGFDILECDSPEEAREIAAAHPVAKFGAIEVRAFDVE